MSKLAHSIYSGIIVIAVIAGIVGFCAWLKAHDAWKDFQKDLAVSQEHIKQNQQVEITAKHEETIATNKIAADTASNDAISAETKRNLASINAQLSQQLTPDQVIAILKREMPNLVINQTKDAQGHDVLAVANTQANRDILNQTDAAFTSCRFNLDDCKQKQANFLDIIKQKDDVIAAKQQVIDAKQASINEYQKDLKEATSFGKGGNVWARTGRVLFPIGCATAASWGASKAKADPKTIAIAGAASGGVCAFKFHF